MTAPWTSGELLQPISEEQPTGQNLEDTALLASFDAYRLYGRTKPLDAAPTPEPDEDAPKTLQDRDEQPPDWGEIKAKSLEALQVSRDLRLLAHLGTALLRTDGLSPFLDTVKVASDWLNSYWDLTYPPVDGDGIVRRSALNCFADPIAVVDALRKAPLVNSRQHGVFSLRDIDVATGQLPPGKTEVRPEESQINGAFAAMPVEDLAALHQRVADAIQSLKAIDAKMREEIGTEAAPSFDLLSTQLGKMDRVLRAQLAARPGAAAEGWTDAEGGAVPSASAGFSGAVRSRQDAIRALEAVAEFFRQNEPSSPVPMFCERAKRLISLDFLEVLADIAPEAVPHARAAGGVKD
jgi:type VI secretion system protein ImpA